MTTTLQQDLEAIATEMTGDRTPAGIAAIALDKLADTQDELAALKAENQRLKTFEREQTRVVTVASGDAHGYSEETVLLSDMLQTENDALQAENERLRAALDSVYRKANSMADYYPEPGTERNAYVSDAPEVFNDIRDTALKALQPK